MISKTDAITLLKISNKISLIIDLREGMTDSDYQGAIEAQVMNAYQLGKQTGEGVK